MSPTQLTIKRLKETGHITAIVEKWNPFAKIRQDLFGFIDILALKDGGKGVLGIQTTTTGNMKARLDKSLKISALNPWLSSGNTFQVWGWSKKGPRGKRKVWQLSVIDVPGDYLHE